MQIENGILGILKITGEVDVVRCLNLLLTTNIVLMGLFNAGKYNQ